MGMVGGEEAVVVVVVAVVARDSVQQMPRRVDGLVGWWVGVWQRIHMGRLWAGSGRKESL